MTTKYHDLGKEGNDLLKKGFPFASNVKVNFENNFDGVELKSTFDRTLKTGKDNVVAEEVSILLEPSFALCSNVKLKGKVSTKADKEVSLEAKDYLLTGSTVELGVNEDSASHFVTAAFVNSQVHVNARYDNNFDVTKPGKVTVGAVLQYPKDVHWGANAVVQKAKDLEYTINGRIHFQFPTYSTTLFYEEKDKQRQLGLLWTQKISDQLKFSAKMVIDQDPSKDPLFEAGFENKDGDSVSKSKLQIAQGLKKDDNKKLRLFFCHMLLESASCLSLQLVQMSMY